MTDLLRIADALSRPLLFHPTKLEVILSALDGRLPGFDVAAPGPEASRFMGRADGGRPYRVADGIAFVPIVGSLANRGAYIGASSGVVSYEGIAMQVRAAAADTSVHSIVLDIDSPGGEATGMFRVAEALRQVRQTKRLVAFVDDMAASAAYGLASQAHEIVVSPTSIVGSIGVVLAHVDRSAELAKAGRTVTLIHAGANKVDGHPYGPLPESVRADMQAEVAAFYAQFLATVAAGRPTLSLDRARATEARTYIGQAAIGAGLADRIGTLESVISGLRTRASARPSSQPVSSTTMTFQPSAPAATPPAPAPLTAAERHAANYRTMRIASDPRVRGHEALAIQLAAHLPTLSAEEIGAKVAAMTGRPGLERTAGLKAALAAQSRRDGGALAQNQAVASPPKSGLARAVAEMVARDTRHR